MVVDTEGRGIGGVVVNDGVGFALTGADGRWALVTDTFRSKFVSISTPAGFRLPQDSGLAAGFFVPVGRAVAGGGWRFVLERRPVAADSFYYVAVSDPQVRNASDMARWRGEAVASLRRTVAALSRSREVVGVALGDLVFDDMGLFDDYAGSVAGMPMTMFQCIGNHDFDRRLPALRHAPEGAPAYAEMAYHRRFGPTDYSFNIGRVHIVTMCNIDYRGGGRYAELLSDSQLSWLERDRKEAERAAKKEAKERARELAKAKETDEAAFSLNNEDRRISGNFESNRGRLPMPITGPYRIVSHFGQYNVEGLKNVRLDNKGINILGQPGAQARSIFDGEVSAVFSLGGTTGVMVRHGSYISVYCNLSSVSVHRGQRVSARQALGTVASDNILQFQLRRETAKLNPESWLGR